MNTFISLKCTKSRIRTEEKHNQLIDFPKHKVKLNAHLCITWHH